MKMNLSYKYLNLIIFLLLVGVVFALFGVINNIPIGNSDKITCAYILLFTILFLVIALFLTTIKSGRKSESNSLSVIADPDVLKNASKFMSNDIVEISESKNEINVSRIIPENIKSVEDFSEQILQNLAQEFNIVQALMYLKTADTDTYESIAQYAYFSESKPQAFKSGETLPGQAIKNRIIVTLTDVPENYMTIASGLGKSGIKYLVFVPLIYKDDVVGLIEYATFTRVNEDITKILGNIAEKIAETMVKLIKK